MFAAPGWGRPSQHEHTSQPCLKSRREHHHHRWLDVFVPWLPALPRGGPVIGHCDIHSQTLKGGKSWKRLGLGRGVLREDGRKSAFITNLAPSFLCSPPSPSSSSHQGQGLTTKEHDTSARSPSSQTHAEPTVDSLFLSFLWSRSSSERKKKREESVISCGEILEFCLSIHVTVWKENKVYLQLWDVFHSTLSLLGGRLQSFVFTARVSPIFVFFGFFSAKQPKIQLELSGQSCFCQERMNSFFKVWSSDRNTQTQQQLWVTGWLF